MLIEEPVWDRLRLEGICITQPGKSTLHHRTESQPNRALVDQEPIVIVKF